MNQHILIALCFLFPSLVQAQHTMTYETEKGDVHLVGEFHLSELTSDTTYSKWYEKNYEAFKLSERKTGWAKNLKGMEVDIYLGTWCGDSKKWVPRFVHLWEELGLEKENLNFIALYGRVDGKYKQGPKGEEVGADVHRVPTFILKDNDIEIARIVESPVNDMETDLAQIAMGYPSEPNYRAATYLLDLFRTYSPEEVELEFKMHLRNVYTATKKPSELNTLGYVLLDAGRIDEALMTFYFNMRCFRYESNVYDSYAEALSLVGDTEEAVINYEKALLLDKNNKDIREKISDLKKLLEEG